MLSQHATERAQSQFPEGELVRALGTIKEIKHEQEMRQKFLRSTVLGKRGNIGRAAGSL